MIETYINGLVDNTTATALRSRMIAEREKLVVRVGNLNLRLKNFSGTLGTIADGIANITKELTASQTVFQSLEEGTDAYYDKMDDIKRLEYQLYMVNAKGRDKSNDILVEVAHDIEVAEFSILKKDELIALLDTKIESFTTAQ